MRPEQPISSAGAALRSLLVPGWGQMATGRPRLGRSLLFATGLIAIGSLAIYLFVPTGEIAAWLADPSILLWIVVANLLFGLVRLASTGMAWRDGGSRNWALAVLIAAIVVIPHVAVAWVGIETRSSLLTVFAPSPIATADTTTTSTTSTTTTTEPFRLSPVTTLPGQYGTDPVEVEKSEPWRPFGEERLNIMLLGGDAGPDRSGLRTDTIMIASIDPLSGDSVLLGLPRNYAGITFSDGDPIPVRRLNHVYGWGHDNPEAFGGPDPGASALADAVTTITGLEIDHFVLVDLTGFAEVVDVLGGVELDVPLAVDGPLYNTRTGGYEMVHIPEGHHHLDGAHALAYARARYGSTDYVRMGRQRCILTSLVRNTNPLSLVTNIGGLLTAIEENITTDIPIDMVPDLVRLMFRVSGDEIRVIGFDSTWRSGVTSDGHSIPDVERIREAVRQLVEDPQNATVLDITTAEESCD